MTSAAHLYVPASEPRLAESAGRRSVATVILDLEDAIALDRKAEARTQAVATLPTLTATHRVWVRINGGDEGRADLAALSPLGLAEGYWIPKAEPGSELDDTVARIATTGARVGLLIESAAGVHELSKMLAAHPDVWVQLGEVDLRADLGMPNGTTDNDRDLDPIRLGLVVAAVRHGVREIVAPVTTQFHDVDAVGESSRHLAALGFNSRACIHPAQLEPVDRAFLPDADELAQARRLLEGFEAAEAAGAGSYRDDDGQMADLATVRRARRLLDR